jgi:hypothetical protein
VRRAWPAVLSLSVLLAACQPGLDAAAPSEREPSLPQVSIAEPAAHSGGTARVAVPSQPAGGLPVDDLDVAGGDLLALWGLPLYRVDGSGLPRPALVETVEVSSDGMRVDLGLHPGSWSDGEPVTGRDLEATVAAVRALDDPREQLSWLAEVEVDESDPSQVTLHLTQPTRRWQSLLSSTGVLPGHVLADAPLDEWESPPPVVGGSFVPVASQPGLGWTFEAHSDGPLGPPALDGIEVVVVPAFDTAIGLLGVGELDAIIGHLAIRPHLRVELLEDDERFTVAPSELRVAAVHGGTQVALRFSLEGVLGGPARLRRDVRAVADVRHLVEGLGAGVEASDERPHMAEPHEAPEELANVDVALVTSNEQELLVEVARLLEAQVRGREGRLRVEGEPSPHDVRRADDLDASLVVRRTWRDQDLRPYLPSGELDVALAAEAVPSPRDAAVEEAWLQVEEHAVDRPLLQARVAHVWHERLEGLEPSAWPGAGLASAHRWRLDDAG